MSAALALLRELNRQHHTMVELAEALDWEGLDKVWKDAEAGFIKLKQRPLPTSLEFHERKEARELIESLLKQQKTVEDRVRPWMEQVRPLLDSFNRFPLKPGNL